MVMNPKVDDEIDRLRALLLRVRARLLLALPREAETVDAAQRCVDEIAEAFTPPLKG